MSLPDDSGLPYSLLQFYATSPYSCSYLPDRLARSQVATPTHLVNGEIYSALIRNGFRRSGAFAYRPHCDGCSACIPLRVVVDEFEPNRTQRRCWQRGNQQLVVRERPLDFEDEHYELYLRYQLARHSGGGMDQDNREQYRHFLLQSHVDTRLVEFRDRPELGGRLRMVSVIDVLDDGLSAVYTFYDCERPQAGYGTFNVLWQIAQTRAIGLPYLYLGYWIEASRKMAYKMQFQPAETFEEGLWQRRSERTAADSTA